MINPGRYLEITVSDEGTGIRKDYLQSIFDPYFTTKQKGSGLGLAVSYSIIRKHGGHILVESSPGSGTTVTIYLPAAEADRPAQKGEAHGDAEAGSGSVLLMDDDESIRRVAGGLLARLGYEMEAAPDSRGTIDLYRTALERGKRFDAVILDLTVPGGPGGKETASAILAMDPGARIIVSSGYSNNPVMSRFREFGFAEVLAKPYRLEDLSRVLSAVRGE